MIDAAYTRRVNAGQLGPLAGIDSGTRGTEYFDAFVSRRSTYIGFSQPTGYQLTSYVAKGEVTLAGYRTQLFRQPDEDSWASSEGRRGILSVDATTPRARTITYSYDPLNRLTAADYTDGTYFHYTYDPVGNRLSEETVSGKTCYRYDDANRLERVWLKGVGEDCGSGDGLGVAYTWDAEFAAGKPGNLLSDGVYTYTYNTANQLVSVSGAGTAVSYGYNGQGDRVSQTVGITTTIYTLDLAAGLTQVLADGADTYLYGNGRIAQYDTSGAQYFLGDALGSVRQLVDANGEVTLAQSYEPYGVVLESVGEGSSSYGFTAEMADSPTGLIYLRARFYSSYLNQFVQPDPIVPDPYHPWEWNRYIYSRNNPINFADPSGMLSCYTGADPNCQISVELVERFAEVIKTGVENGVILPVEGFAQTVDFAYWLFEQDYSGMMWALTDVINGFDSNEGAVWRQVFGGRTSEHFIGQDWLPYKHNPLYDDPNWGGGENGTWIHSLRGDWREEYWDKTANQAYHFWFYVAVAYFDGTALSGLGNLIHDTPGRWVDYDFIHSPEYEPPPPGGNSEPDYRLGVAGRQLGSRMRKEYLDFYMNFGRCPGTSLPPLLPLSFNPGNWIRTNLK